MGRPRALRRGWPRRLRRRPDDRRLPVGGRRTLLRRHDIQRPRARNERHRHELQPRLGLEALRLVGDAQSKRRRHIGLRRNYLDERRYRNHGQKRRDNRQPHREGARQDHRDRRHQRRVDRKNGHNRPQRPQQAYEIRLRYVYIHDRRSWNKRQHHRQRLRRGGSPLRQPRHGKRQHCGRIHHQGRRTGRRHAKRRKRLRRQRPLRHDRKHKPQRRRRSSPRHHKHSESERKRQGPEWRWGSA